jgi:hypothetical protein
MSKAKPSVSASPFAVLGFEAKRRLAANRLTISFATL